MVDSMNPTADVQGLSTVELSQEPIAPGQRVTAKWRSQPVFIGHRTPERIAAVRADDSAGLRDPENDRDRIQRAEWLVVVGTCTHLGCVPLGQHEGDPLGQWGGWFCPCHGSHYETSGRIRKGSAPLNLAVPPYEFVDQMRILIG